MLKSKDEIISEFNSKVNMSVEELEAWLNSEESNAAGTGVGYDSGKKIIEILKKNPSKDLGGYDDEDIEHMRSVVAYHARHMAQEDYLKDAKTSDELEKTKSNVSTRNWGHDPLKTLGDSSADKVEVSSAVGPETATEDAGQQQDKVGGPIEQGKRKRDAEDEDGDAIEEKQDEKEKEQVPAETQISDKAPPAKSTTTTKKRAKKTKEVVEISDDGGDKDELEVQKATGNGKEEAKGATKASKKKPKTAKA